MIYEEFLDLVKRSLEERMGEEYAFEITKTLKNNSEYRMGLRVKTDNTNVYPCIYMEAYYDNFMHGRETLDELLVTVMESVKEAIIKKPIDISFFMDWEKVKTHVYFRVINTEQNQELLDTVPHKEVLDLSVIYHVNVGCFLPENPEGFGSIIIRDEHLKLWNITQDALHECALQNVKDKQKAELRDMTSVIEEMKAFIEIDDRETEEMPIPMYILRNKNSQYGAAQLIIEETLMHVSEKLNGDFIVLPSSIYELIVIPSVEIPDLEGLKDLVKEVNNTQVDPIDRLSYNIYRYDRDRERLEIVA